MVLPDEYAGYYPEEQTETIIDIAKPEAVGPMPPANYQIAGPLAEHKPDTAMKDAMASFKRANPHIRPGPTELAPSGRGGRVHAERGSHGSRARRHSRRDCS